MMEPKMGRVPPEHALIAAAAPATFRCSERVSAMSWNPDFLSWCSINRQPF